MQHDEILWRLGIRYQGFLHHGLPEGYIWKYWPEEIDPGPLPERELVSRIINYWKRGSISNKTINQAWERLSKEFLPLAEEPRS